MPMIADPIARNTSGNPVNSPTLPVNASMPLMNPNPANPAGSDANAPLSAEIGPAILPAAAIYIEGADDSRPYPERVGVDARYASVYRIDYGRCILCGFCVEACPKDAIKHGHDFEMASYTREGLLRSKDALLANRDRQRSLHITIRT